MITASHHPFYLLFYKSVVFLMMQLFFSRIKVRNHTTNNGKALLIIGNHFSWWDGFFGLYATEKALKRKLFVMMLEDQLAKRKFLSKIGAFSIKKNCRSVVDTFKYATYQLSNPKHAVLLFPQGRFQSQGSLPLQFQKGWIRIPKDAGNNHQMVFMACIMDYFSHMRPSLTIYLKDYTPPFDYKNPDVESAYNAFYLECLQHQNAQS
ncbi:MAG TPA: lysophospholipid acyltransferase family protein [Bacteroidales bacterium]|nr:lysophospholipid acyltransferase family protein [Bacteroidales bacterium]